VVLFPTPPLTSADQAVPAGIEEMRDSLRHQVRTHREETLAYQRMMTYVQSLHDVVDFDYSKGQLKALHWMLQGHRHTHRKPAGQWRVGPVYVTDPRDPRVAAYTAPDAAEVPELMAELVAWLNAGDDSHPLIRAAMAHLHLVSIHRWNDGNGRMSRSLQTLLIAREGVLAPEFSSIEAWLGRDRASRRRRWSVPASRSRSPRPTRTTDRRRAARRLVVARPARPCPPQHR
jgi:Fic family protein